MQQKLRKIRLRKISGRPRKIKIRYLGLALMLGVMIWEPHTTVRAESCPDLKIVFARGSGGERNLTDDYLEFKSTIETKLKTVDLSYEFIDLDYPAVGVGFDNPEVTLGAAFGSGDAYEFGESVNTGVKNLKKMINNEKCANTQYVIGGYSQGAMVVSKALSGLDSNRIIYAATFGDPKIYLPEGAGIIPAACKGENLSDYRMYVPDCQAYKGLLGAYIPYEPSEYAGKVGTWCNKRDIFCSSHLNVSDHVSYVADALYEDASRVIFDKITKYFGIENYISSPHDTAFLIDSTGSMMDMIDTYKAEALRLAKETLESGGRVALYDYRDLADPYTPVEHCNFETCNLAVFQEELAKIQPDGGGDTPESLLSASFHVMKTLKWKYGATKSLVVLTDANFLSPDRDGMTFDEVVAMSKRIDPVNFYIITNGSYGDDYADLARETDGKVVTNFDELSLLTDYIMERYDSLPMVEEGEAAELPAVEIDEVRQTGASEVTVKFTNTGTKVLIVLNDAVLGVAEGDTVTITGLDETVENILTLIPLGDDVRGEGVNVKLTINNGAYGNAASNEVIIPKAPNTGKA